MINVADLITALISLLQNVSLLVAMSFVFSTIRPSIQARTPRFEPYIAGFIFGLFSVIAIYVPLTISPGVIFDGRNIMVLIAGMFAGWQAAIIAAMMAILARFAVGGLGAPSAALSLAVTAALGCWAYYRLAHRRPVYTVRQMLALGLVMALQGLSWGVLLLPAEMAGNILRSIGLPLVVLYPAGVWLIGALLAYEFRKDELEHALRESEERFRQMAENINQVFWMRDLKTDKVLYMNPKYETIWGQPVADIYQDTRAFASLVHPDDRDWVVRERREKATIGFEQEYRIIRADGAVRWISSRGFPVRDARGQVYRVAGVSEDITERRRSEERLRRIADVLEHNNQELEAFAYMASHDLQEPLRKIQAFGDRLESGWGETLDEQGRDYIQRMRNAASRMQGLIDALLEYSRVTTLARPFEQVDLGKVTQDVLSDLEVAISEADAQVEVGELSTIEVDAVQMRQLLQNLIGNALKFRSPERKPLVKISGHMLSMPLPGIRGGPPAPAIYEIRVEDNGIGFEPAYQERIFGLFQRLHGRSEYPGTGVGLSICRRIVERHGGSIVADGRPGEGATFIIQLPAAQPDEEVSSL